MEKKSLEEKIELIKKLFEDTKNSRDGIVKQRQQITQKHQDLQQQENEMVKREIELNGGIIKLAQVVDILGE